MIESKNEKSTNQIMSQSKESSTSSNYNLENVKKIKLFKVSNDYLLREIAGEYVLVPVGDGAERFNGMLALNETFKYIWNQFEEPHTINEIIKKAQEDFEGVDGQIENDICRFVEESLYYGLLTEEVK